MRVWAYQGQTLDSQGPKPKETLHNEAREDTLNLRYSRPCSVPGYVLH